MDSNAKNDRVQQIARTAILGALVLVTTAFNPVGWGPVQIRVSEILVVLPFFNRKNIPGVVIGMGIANAFSPMGPVDVLVSSGTFAISYTLSKFIENNYINAIQYSLTAGVLVGAMLHFVLGLPFIYNFVSVSISTSIMAVVGVWFIEKNRIILEKRNVI